MLNYFPYGWVAWSEGSFVASRVRPAKFLEVEERAPPAEKRLEISCIYTSDTLAAPRYTAKYGMR